MLLPEHLRLRRRVGEWGRRDFADVYIDDVATLAAVRRERTDKKDWDDRFIEDVDDFYARVRAFSSPPTRL